MQDSLQPATRKASAARLCMLILMASVLAVPLSAQAMGPDTCLDADGAPLTLPFCISDDNIGAGVDGIDCGSGNYNGPGIFYRVDGLTIGLDYRFVGESATDFDWNIGTTCGGGEILCQDRQSPNDDPSCSTVSATTWGYATTEFTATTTSVYIHLAGYGSANTGTYYIQMEELVPADPVADTCSSPELSNYTVNVDVDINASLSTDVEFEIDTTGLANDYANAACTDGNAGLGPDAVVLLSGHTQDKRVQVTWSASFNENLYVVTNCGDVVNTCLQGSDFSTSATETLRFCVEVGTDYYIIADGRGSADEGEGTLIIEDLGDCLDPFANTCAEADIDPNWEFDLDLNANLSIYLDTIEGSNDYNDDNCGNSSSVAEGRDVVVKFTNSGSSDKFVTFDYTGTTGDPDFLLYENDCNPTSCVYGVDSLSDYSYCIPAGGVVYVIFDSYASSFSSDTWALGTLTVTDEGACPLPPADTCADADSDPNWQIDATTDLPFASYIDTTGLADDYDNGSCGGNSSVADGNDAVARLSNPGATDIYISVTVPDQSSDPDILVFDGNCSASFCVAASDSPSAIFCLPAGATYYVVFDSYGTSGPESQGTLTIESLGSCPGAPADTCADADASSDWQFDVAVDFNLAIPFDNAGMTDDYDASGCGSSFVGSGADQVMRFTNSGSPRTVRFSVSSGSGDPDLILFSDCSTDCLVYTDTGDISVFMDTGDTYYLALDSYSSTGESSGVLEVEDLGGPPPDTCSDADADPEFQVDINMTLSWTKLVNTLGLANDYNAAHCGSDFVGRGADAAIRVENSASVPKAFSVTGTSESGDPDTLILRGSCPGGLTCVDYDDGRDTQLCLAPGEVVYVIVDTYGANAASSSEITITTDGLCPDAGFETCIEADAAPVELGADLPYLASFNTDYAANDYHSSCATSNSADGVVKVTNSTGAPINMEASWEFDDTLDDASLLLVTDCSDVEGTCVIGADELSGPATVTHLVLPGESYYLIYDGFGNDERGDGNLTIVVSPDPIAGSTCDTAISLSAGEVVNGTTEFRGNNPDANFSYSACSLGDAAGEDVWHDLGSVAEGLTLTATVTGDVDVYLVSGSCGALTCLASGDTTLTHVMASTEDAYLVVDHNSADAGGAYSITYDVTREYPTGFTVGDTSCSNTFNNLPINAFFGYTESQYYIPEANLSGAGLSGATEITKIAFLYCSGTVSAAETAVDFFLSQSGSVPSFPVDKGTLVAADVDLEASGDNDTWVEIELDTPFLLLPGNNLIVTSCEKQAGFDSTTNWASNDLTDAGIYRLDDSIQLDCDLDTSDDFSTPTSADEWVTIGIEGTTGLTAPTPTPTPNASSQTVSAPGVVVFFPSTPYELTMNFTSVTGGPITVSVDTFGFLHPSIFSSQKVIQRYFDISATPSSASFEVDVTFTYDPAEFNTGMTEGNDMDGAWRLDPANGWEFQGGTVDTANNTVTVTGVTEFSDWTLGSDETIIEAAVPTITEWGVIFLLGALSFFVWHTRHRKEEF